MKKLILTFITILIAHSLQVFPTENFTKDAHITCNKTNDITYHSDKSPSQEIIAAQKIISNILSKDKTYFNARDQKMEPDTIWNNILLTFGSREVNFNDISLKIQMKEIGWGLISVIIKYYEKNQLISKLHYIDDYVENRGYWNFN